MTPDRLEEIGRLTNRPDAYGFRSECQELVGMCRRLLDDNGRMRSLKVMGDWGPLLVADACERVAKACDSSLHEAAALMIRRLMQDLAVMQDACHDAPSRGSQHER